jgi:DNA-directed RNA polymerase sigma subunit (sigma70/sigma32)
VGDEELTPRERRVLELVEGTIDGHQRTIEQVAARFGMTRERIEQILASAREKRGR